MDRGSLRARDLAGIGCAGDRDSAVEAHLECGSALDPEEIVAAPRERDVARRIEDVAVARLELEPDVAVGKIDRTIVSGKTARRGSVECQRLREIEEAQRSGRARHAPVLDGARFPPGAGLVALAPGDACRGFAQEPGRARRDRRRERGRGGEDRFVHFGRVAFRVEQADRGQLRRRIAGRSLQRADPELDRRERLGAVFGALRHSQQRQRRGAVGLEVAFGPRGIGGDQVAIPAGLGLQRRIALRGYLDDVQLVQRIVRISSRSGAMAHHTAREEQDKSDLPQCGTSAEAVRAAGAASTLRCSAASRRPRKARKAP